MRERALAGGVLSLQRGLQNKWTQKGPFLDIRKMPISGDTDS